MLRENRNRLASLALASALTMTFGGAALAQDYWDGTPGDVNDAAYNGSVYHHAAHYRAYGRPYAYDNGYYRNGYYRDGYYNAGPLGIPGSAVCAADATVAAATGYPPYYGGPAYGYANPYYNNGWWGPTHTQYQEYGYW